MDRHRREQKGTPRLHYAAASDLSRLAGSGRIAAVAECDQVLRSRSRSGCETVWDGLPASTLCRTIDTASHSDATPPAADSRMSGRKRKGLGHRVHEAFSFK